MTFTATTVPILGMYNSGGAFPTPGASAWNSGPTTNMTGQYFGFYSGFQDDVASFIAQCQANGLTAFVELEPWYDNDDGVAVAVPFSDITGGTYDSELEAIGSSIAAGGVPVILTWAHEFNVSGQYPWSQNAVATLSSGVGSGPGGADLTPAEWITGWNYVVAKVNSTAGGNALWMWACSAYTGGTTISPAPYWPSGGELPQMVGIDGYPDTAYGAALGTFSGQILPTVTIIRGLGWTDPIFISETNLAQMVSSGGESITSFVADMYNNGVSGIFEFEESYEPDMTEAQWDEYNTAVAAYYGTPGTGGGTGGSTGGSGGTGGLVTTYTQTLYDDFPGSSLSTTLWTEPVDSNGISVSGGSLKIEGLTNYEQVVLQTTFSRDLADGIFALQLSQSGSGVTGTMWFLGIADGPVSDGGNAYEFQTFPAGGSAGGPGSWYAWAFSGTDVSGDTGADNILAPSVWVNGNWLGIGDFNLDGNNEVHVYSSSDAFQTMTEIASFTVTGAINESAVGFYFGTNYDSGTTGTSTYLATIQNVSWFERGTSSGGGGTGGGGTGGGGGSSQGTTPGALVSPAQALAQLYPGSRLPGARLRGFLPLAAYKAQVQAVVSNAATLVDDDALLVQLVANAVYRFKCVLGYAGDVSGSGDIDLTWVLPSGASMGYSLYSYKTGVATAGFWQTAVNISLNTDGPGTQLAAVLKGSVQMAGTDGLMQLTWKQNTSSATPTQVLAGSSLLAWRIQ